MTISSINTNLAALLAQTNIGVATQSSSDDVAALSSGNRIVNASTDVAALAAGTALVSQVNTLNTALSVASQGSSLLQVADGGLAQIQSILQRQQAITTSAQSGSLSSTQLGFLDQEFQSLTQEIDQLAGSTNFNGVNLIDGSIAGGASVTTNTTAGNGGTPLSVVIATIDTAPTTGTTLTVDGVKITLAANNAAATGDVTQGTTTAATAANIAAYLNQSGNAALADLRFSSSGGSISASYTGTATTPGTLPSVITSTSDTTNIVSTGTHNFTVQTVAAIATVSAGDTFTINGFTVTEIASGTPTSSQIVAGTTGAAATNLAALLNSSATQTSNPSLKGLTFVASNGVLEAYWTGGSGSPTLVTNASNTSNITGTGSVTIDSLGNNGLGNNSYSAQGTIQGSTLFVSGGLTDIASGAGNYGQAVDLSSLNSNADFIGNFGGTGTIGAITANYTGGSTPGVTFSVTVGKDTYTTQEIASSTLSGTPPTALVFTGNNSTTGALEGGSFTLNLQGGQASISSQNGADNLAEAINAGLSGVSVYQNRNVLSYNNNFSAIANGTETGTLQGSSLTYNSNDFSSTPLISSVSVSAPSTGTTDAKISLVINGQTFVSQSGIGDTLSTNTVYTFTNSTNPDETVSLTTGSTAYGSTSGVAADLSTSSNAAAFQTALTNALGISSAQGGLSFQVGSASTDTINITLGSATSSSLFGGATLDVKTQADAVTAAAAVTNALNTVTALRATVGAGEERFNFATSAIQSASQNENAARSSLLDTDVASTSTNFATAQVQLQAGIAVLAQANQLQQNLLKLIA